MENCPKIIKEVFLRKNSILGIAIENFDKNLSVSKSNIQNFFILAYLI